MRNIWIRGMSLWRNSTLKRILFDLWTSQPTGTSKYHGGGEYIKIVFKNLIMQHDNDCNISVYYNQNAFIDDWIKELIAGHDISMYNVDSVDDLAVLLKKESFDIIYSGLPYYFRKDIFPNGIIIKGTIHSIRNVEMPVDKYTYLYQNGLQSKKSFIKYWLWQITKYDSRKNIISGNKLFIECMDQFITDSLYSKFSLVECYPELDANQIKVYYAPATFETVDNNNSTNDGKYILLIGGNRWEKNTLRAFFAIDELIDSGYLTGYSVKVVGKPGKRIERKIRHRDIFTFFDYLKSDELFSLYENCSMFMYPSLNEGFGLPPMEAMKYGKTCVISAVCSLPEIYGESVYWVNPSDIYEMKNRILMALNNPISPELIKKKVNQIISRQNQDLNRICDFIVN